ncbi:MAG: DNA polymerase III subunit delta [Bacteroidota bacterium]
MTFENIIADLKNRIYHPIYFLTGDEPYYIDLITDYIAANLLSEAEKAFNLTIIYGKDVNAGAVMNHAKRFPMMANHQVVIVKEAQEMGQFEDLIHYVEHPLKSTVLVLNYKYKSPDKRKKVFKLLQEKAVYFESKKLYDDKIPGWINAYVAAKKYTIQPKAAALVAEFLGSDLSKIVNELEKLIISLDANEKSITPAHVERIIGISKEFNQFELQKALGKKDVLTANRIINYFGQNQKNNHISQTISSLYFFFSKLLIYYYTEDKSKQNIAAVLKVNPFFVADYVEAARNYPAKKLVEIIALLREYDLKSKGYDGAAQEAGDLLKELVFKILH